MISLKSVNYDNQVQMTGLTMECGCSDPTCISMIDRLATSVGPVNQLQCFDTLLLSYAKGYRNPYWILDPVQEK